MKQYHHIIWNVFAIYPPWDERGDWDYLIRTYEQLKDHDVELKFEKDLPGSFQNKGSFEECIAFNAEQIEFLKTEIAALTKENGDRICGNLPIQFLDIEKTYVELIIHEEEEVLKQKIARLKSRLATLLSFKFPETFQGKNTWGKGLWVVQFHGEVDKAIELIKENQQNGLKKNKKRIYKRLKNGKGLEGLCRKANYTDYTIRLDPVGNSFQLCTFNFEGNDVTDEANYKDEKIRLYESFDLLIETVEKEFPETHFWF